MTTFTRIRINPRHRAARHALAFERAHPRHRPTGGGRRVPDGNQQRTLWRLDPGHTVHALYIVSSGYVNAAVIQEQLGAELSDIATCSYDPFLGQLATGQQWRFRLKANPTKNIGSCQPGVRGKRIPITKQDEQIEWLTRQASRCGFHVPINRLDVPRGHRQGFRRRLVHEAGPAGDVAFGHLRRIPGHRRPGSVPWQALITGIGRGRGVRIRPAHHRPGPPIRPRTTCRQEPEMADVPGIKPPPLTSLSRGRRIVCRSCMRSIAWSTATATP